MAEDMEPKAENAEEVEQLIGDLEAHAAEDNLAPEVGDTDTCPCSTGTCPCPE
jgi:hypothetical protein